MKKFNIIPFLLITFSCKKNCDYNTSIIPLNETRWILHYKNNNTFNFYAESELYFKENKIVDNYRNFDTISGNWTLNFKTVTLNFNNGDNFSGTVITNDSISGTLTTAGNNGVWYAIRK